MSALPLRLHTHPHSFLGTFRVWRKHLAPGPPGVGWSALSQPRVLDRPQASHSAALCWGGGGCWASAGRLTALPGLPRVVYRTVYRQVVKMDHRKRLKCCQGFYESRGACVRESWAGRGTGRAEPPFLGLPCTPQGGAAPLPFGWPPSSRSPGVVPRDTDAHV